MCMHAAYDKGARLMARRFRILLPDTFLEVEAPDEAAALDLALANLRASLTTFDLIAYELEAHRKEAKG